MIRRIQFQFIILFLLPFLLCIRGSAQENKAVASAGVTISFQTEGGDTQARGVTISFQNALDTAQGRGVTVGFGNPPTPTSLLGQAPHSGFNADPVNTATGNYVFQRTDLTILGRGMNFEFTRFYNSLDQNPGPLGVGWTHSYNMTAIQKPDASISVRWGDGHIDIYNNAGGVYQPRDKGVFDILVKNPDGTVTVTKKDQKKYNFLTNGRLSTIVDRNGNTITLNYDGSGNLATLIDTVGRSIIFTYDPGGRITDIADLLPRVITFTYDANNNLASSTDPRGNTTNYTYDSMHQMLTAADPRGNTFVTNVYDANNRVIQQTDAKGNIHLFAYDLASGKTTITDPFGNQSFDFHDLRSRLYARYTKMWSRG